MSAPLKMTTEWRRSRVERSRIINLPLCSWSASWENNATWQVQCWCLSPAGWTVGQGGIQTSLGEREPVLLHPCTSHPCHHGCLAHVPMVPVLADASGQVLLYTGLLDASSMGICDTWTFTCPVPQVLTSSVSFPGLQ